MRIISKQHDYYDGVQAYGQDQTVVFDRTVTEVTDLPKEVTKHFWNVFSRVLEPRKTKTGEFKLIPFAVIFCGKLYKGIRVQRDYTVPSTTEKGQLEYKTEFKCWYNSDGLLLYLADNGITFDNKYSWVMNNKTEKQTVEAYLENQGSDVLMEWCIQNRYITFTWEGKLHFKYPYKTEYTAIANGILQPYEFFRVIEAYQAYQELDMFVSGTLPQSNAMTVDISDKDRIQQHGFDKWSFRKMPQSKS